MERLIHSIHNQIGVHINWDLILAVQDGNDPAVQKVVRQHSNASLLHSLASGNKMSISERITSHYKISIQKTFEKFTDAPSIIILEDDLVLSPDFLQYFNGAARLLDRDASLWCVAAWNDNGFQAHLAQHRIHRTDFFPGLGWLLQREVWHAIDWPRDHWDWYLRSSDFARGRQCLYPELPRVEHPTDHGSFMNRRQFGRYFQNMQVQKAPLTRSWDARDFESGEIHKYDSSIVRLLLHQSIHIMHGRDLQSASSYIPGMVFVIWIDINPDPRYTGRAIPLARMFHIWHELQRASYKGIIRGQFRQATVLLINLFELVPRRTNHSWYHGRIATSSWSAFKPPYVPVFRNGHTLFDQIHFPSSSSNSQQANSTFKTNEQKFE